jgi:hypothetical protein
MLDHRELDCLPVDWLRVIERDGRARALEWRIGNVRTRSKRERRNEFLRAVAVVMAAAAVQKSRCRD